MFDKIPFYLLLIISYLLVINIISFFSMMTDKLKSKKRKHRTPESVLITLAIIGGSVGAILGMDVFHHKTRHKKFSVGLPLILLAQILLSISIFIASSSS